MAWIEDLNARVRQAGDIALEASRDIHAISELAFQRQIESHGSNDSDEIYERAVSSWTYKASHEIRRIGLWLNAEGGRGAEDETWRAFKERRAATVVPDKSGPPLGQAGEIALDASRRLRELNRGEGRSAEIPLWIDQAAEEIRRIGLWLKAESTDETWQAFNQRR